MMLETLRLGCMVREAPVGTPQLLGALRVEMAPAALSRGHVAFAPAMDGNDTLSDCTAAGLANAIRAQAAIAGVQVGLATADVVRFYSASTGYDPNNPATDSGGYETDVLSYQLAHGFAASAQVPWVGLWGTIDPRDLNGVRLAMTHMGCAYLGVELALADQGGGRWDTTTAGDQTPGSWGGHCLLAWAYDGIEPDSTVWLATWGRLVPATWRWVASRCMEAHGVAHRQLLGPDGRNGVGVDWDRLAAECVG